MTNLIHHGVDDPGRVRRGNTLTKPISSYTEEDEVEIIATNVWWKRTGFDQVEFSCRI